MFSSELEWYFRTEDRKCLLKVQKCKSVEAIRYKNCKNHERKWCQSSSYTLLQRSPTFSLHVFWSVKVSWTSHVAPCCHGKMVSFTFLKESRVSCVWRTLRTPVRPVFTAFPWIQPMTDEHSDDRANNKLAGRRLNHVSDTSAGTMKMNSGIMDGQWTERRVGDGAFRRS